MMNLAKSIAREVIEVFEYLLREEEKRLAFEEVVRIVQEALPKINKPKPSEN